MDITPTPRLDSRRKPRIRKSRPRKVETNETPKVESTEVSEIQTIDSKKAKIEAVSEVQTKEVQESQAEPLQQRADEQIEGEEILELIETIDQDLDIHSKAFLESDPLYREYKAAQLPKYQRLDVKLYVLLRDDQLEFLARLTRQIMKNRTSDYKIERITKNTIIRALIDNLKELELDVRNIPDETELAKRIADSIRSVRLTSLANE